MNKIVKLVLIGAVCAGMAACAKKQEVKPVVQPEPETTTAPVETGPAAFTPADLETNTCLRQRVVYFDFNMTEIRPEFQEQIACHAKYLRDRPDSRMLLDGNADERGSREYNLGLGERRAKAVAAALEAAGAAASQITVVSHGEEQPVCREHNEACWQKNRRAEISYTVK
ncbi:MAG TPA: peptidoglycan-associated lipoprotein Pal [Rhodanobacteraceae bacterium]|nr:peptidoglycan-associated lipoprotein Pal [Rhodanobacteraceae bacterium]